MSVILTWSWPIGAKILHLIDEATMNETQELTVEA